ncbi:MAG: hypothetical protein E7774_00975 [Bradyrhizobium sp.]|nr:MAG: hypothetical protein E7774_00975 [Bradyrhizobium sp.]
MTTKGLLLALVGAGALALSAQSASARIVCNASGDCWHTQGDAQFKPELKLTVHPDDWKWKESEHNRWREHDGRGYWQGGEWKSM